MSGLNGCYSCYYLHNIVHYNDGVCFFNSYVKAIHV